MAASASKDIVLVQDGLKKEYGDTYMASYRMKKPSSLPDSVLLLNGKYPKVTLLLIPRADLPRLSAMQNINHINIMRIEAVKKIGTATEDQLALFVDRNNGPLGAYLHSLQLHDNYNVILSEALRDIIRQIIAGLRELRRNGSYHGDLSLNNIYFSKNGKLLIKLFNFRSKDIAKEVAQLQDCVDLGQLLQLISDRLKIKKPHLIYAAIDDLASALKSFPIASLQTVEEIVFKKTFFWEPRRRIIFWIHDVPTVLVDLRSVQAINAHTWKFPWTSHTHQGLLEEMNAYRVEEEKRKRADDGIHTPLTEEEKKRVKYKEDDPLHYVKCISCAYTHEDKLKGKLFDKLGRKITVDTAVQSTDADFFIVLYKVLKGAGTIQD